jgi:NADH-quinone oxidoreductase subunit E
MFKGMLELKRKPKLRGRHLIRVCHGTYCNNGDETRILDSIERTLGINAGETTSDGKFTLEVVNCLNHCNEGPVIEIDGQCYERVSSDDIGKTLSSYD